mgnify:CR=1 FL=1
MILAGSVSPKYILLCALKQVQVIVPQYSEFREGATIGTECSFFAVLS